MVRGTGKAPERPTSGDHHIMHNGDVTSGARLVLSQHVAPELSSPAGREYFKGKASPYAKVWHDFHLETTSKEHGLKTGKKELNAAHSPDELVSSGALIDKTSASGEKKIEVTPPTDKSSPKVTVELQDANASHKPTPHFLVRENGQIEMHGNPETLNSKDIKIVLERKEGQLNPSEAQSKATDELVAYLSQRIKSRYPDATRLGVELDDKDDVVSASTEQKNHLRPPRSQMSMTEETRESIGEAHRFAGAGGVDMPRAQTDRMGSFGTRDVPRQANETEKEMALKEAAAGLFRPDSLNAYETVRKHPDGSFRVGRYGFSGNQLLNLLEGLGDPPDPALIEKLIKEGKLPKGFAEKLKNPEFLKKFKDFAHKLQMGKEPSKDELKEFLPKDAQESFGTMLIEQMRSKVGDNPGAIATAILTGKTASDLNQSDFNTPEAKQLMTAGQRLYDIASNRQSTEQKVVGNIPQGERRALIEEALTLSGVPVTQANLAAVNLIVQHESNWNPNIVNNWDSNAAKGTPSKGLMQTIGPTFNAYSLPGHKNIFDPLDNLVAGIRYAVSRYGSLQNVPGVKAMASGLAYRGY